MAFEVEELERVFVYGDNKLEDPARSMSLEQVKEFYAGQYPELNNSNVSAPEVKDGKLHYSFSKKNYGTKG
jgi:PRTRC genetic system protein C